VQLAQPWTERERVLVRQNGELVARSEALTRRLRELTKPAVIVKHRRVDADAVRAFYRDAQPAGRMKAPVIDPTTTTLTNTPTGLGDCVVLTDLPRAAFHAGASAKIYSPSQHFATLGRFNPWFEDRQDPVWVSLSAAVAAYQIGPGHNIQRARRLFGLPIDPVPRGCIEVERVLRVPGRVSLHFDPGPHAHWQRRHLHPRARMIYPDTMRVIRQFIAAHGDMTFIEIGPRRLLNDERVADGTGVGLEDTIRLMSECEFHLGVISGPMHVAVALGLKTIAIINFPHPGQLMLPNLVATGMVEEEWLYPQQVVLHQDHDSAHWPLFSRKSLEAAFDGGVYPYWRTDVAEELAA